MDPRLVSTRPVDPQAPKGPESQSPRLPLRLQTPLSPCAAFLPSARSIWVSPARSVYVRPGKKTHRVLVQVQERGVGVADEDLYILASPSLLEPHWQGPDEALWCYH